MSHCNTLQLPQLTVLWETWYLLAFSLPGEAPQFFPYKHGSRPKSPAWVSVKGDFLQNNLSPFSQGQLCDAPSKSCWISGDMGKGQEDSWLNKSLSGELLQRALFLLFKIFKQKQGRHLQKYLSDYFYSIFHQVLNFIQRSTFLSIVSR